MNLKENLAISESGFIFHPETGESYSVNEQGQEIITLLKDGKNYNDISDFIQHKYDVTESTFEKDYQDFIILLEKYQFAKDEQGKD